MKPLEGKLAVVTGASKGIGLATARALREAGATVVRWARSLNDESRDGFHDLRCDLADAAEIVRATTIVLEQWGTPAIVVNNAGAYILRRFEETELAELDRHYAINVRAPFAVAQGFLPAMRGAGAGHLISVGSTCDHLAFPDNSAYTATKFALRGLHEVLAAEYRGTGIRFTLVSPGATDTGIWGDVDPDQAGDVVPRSQMLHPEDVANAIVYAATRPRRVLVEWISVQPSGIDVDTDN